MIRQFKALKKCAVHGSDGSIGHLNDLFIDDEDWNVRYFVVEVGSWMHPNKVLLSPAGLSDRSRSTPEDLFFDLNRQQISSSPPVDTEKPVSRQHEADLYRYYGWTPYWTAFAPVGLGAMGMAVAATGLAAAVPSAGRSRSPIRHPSRKRPAEILICEALVTSLTMGSKL